jgi:RimJ/RimL family protein N-acetyltransferase
VSDRKFPVIETERLKLRKHQIEDLPDAAKMWADPLVTRFIGGKPFTRQQTWAKILTYTGHWDLLGFGYWAIEEKASGKFIGEAGFADFKREMTPSIEGIPELGWVLSPKAHGRRYSTEALRAILDWADIYLESKRTICIIRPEHAVSIRVAEKCGYREILRAIYTGEPTVLFERVVS